MTIKNTKIPKYQFKFINFEKAFLKLTERQQMLQNSPDDELIQTALIQTFEYTFELAWKTLKEYMLYKGIDAGNFPRDIIKTGFQNGLISNGKLWLEALEYRNKTSHPYNQNIARQIATRVIQSYQPALAEIHKTIKNDLQ